MAKPIGKGKIILIGSGGGSLRISCHCLNGVSQSPAIEHFIVGSSNGLVVDDEVLFLQQSPGKAENVIKLPTNSCI
ncbi:MAG: hypothetical protein AAF399_09695 [Bacteroidota bacterium]